MADSSKQNRIGDLLKMVRGKRDLSQAAFAARLQDLFGQRWTLDIVKHLEDGSTKFRQWHLDDLVSAGFMEDQGRVYWLFQDAMERQWLRGKTGIVVDQLDEEQQPEKLVLDFRPYRNKKVLLAIVVSVLLIQGALWGQQYFKVKEAMNLPEALKAGPASELGSSSGSSDSKLERIIDILFDIEWVCSEPALDLFYLEHHNAWDNTDLMKISATARLSVCFWRQTLEIDEQLVSWTDYTNRHMQYYWDTSRYGDGTHTIEVTQYPRATQWWVHPVVYTATVTLPNQLMETNGTERLLQQTD